MIYFLAEHYPFWGFPLALILIELARFFWRNGYLTRTILTLGLSVVLLVLGVMYFVEDGFHTVRPTLKNAEQTYISK